MKEPLKKGPPRKNSRKQYQKPKKQVKKNKHTDLVGLAIIILLGIIIYSNSFNCSFHFDDNIRIVNNASIRNLADVKAWWGYYPTRPVGMFTFALNYHFNQLHVQYYHFINLVIHLINACLVWWLTQLIFSTPVLNNHPIAGQKKIIAFFTALLFVSHPLATQSVTYIVQRLASMVAMFYLLSLALYVKARLTNKSKQFKYILFTGSLISAVLAMLTKENAFTLPLAIVLFEIFFLRTKKNSIYFKDYRVIILLVAFLSAIIIIPLTSSLSIFKPIRPSYWGNAYTITSLNYLFTQFSVIVKYIQLLFLPINQNVDYDFPVSNNFFEIRTLLCFLVLLSLIILAIFLFKKYRIISFGILWFFLTLSIESSFIPISDVIFEHRTYLPSFGFFLILSSAVFVLPGKKYQNIAIIVLVIITGANSVLTYARNKVWKNEITLWSDVISKTPNKTRPLYNLGVAYGNLGQWDKAITDYTKAIEIDPKFKSAYSNRGIAYGNLRQLDKAIADCSKAIEIDPEFTDAYSNRGVSYGNFGQWDKAISDYSKAIEIDPKYAVAYANRGVAYFNLGQLDKAIADCSKAIEIDPKYAKAYYNRGNVNKNLKQWNKAITDYSSAIEINPDYIDAYVNRGVAFRNLGQWEKAIADYSRAIGIDPNSTDAYSNRGNIYGNLGQWDKTIADYSRAIEIDPKNVMVYFNRGGAYCYLGQWDKAIADYSKAIEINPGFKDAYTNRDFAFRKLNNKNKR